MEIIGYILIALVIALLFWYFRWSQKEVKTQLDNNETQRVRVTVQGTYSPNVIRVIKGKPLVIIFNRKEDTACSKKVIIADFGIATNLVDFGETEVKFIPDKAGEFLFTCEMGMYQGKLIVEEKS